MEFFEVVPARDESQVNLLDDPPMLGVLDGHGQNRTDYHDAQHHSDHEFDTVVETQRDAIAVAQTCIAQEVRESPTRDQEFPIRHAPRTTDQSDVLRSAMRCGLERVVQQHREF